MRNKITKTIAVLCLTWFGHLSAQAQQDFQINLSNLILYEAAASHEVALSPNATLSAFGGYVYGFPGQDEHRYYYIGPELKFYPFPTTKGADLFFVGVYGRYKSGYTETDFYEYGEIPGTPDYLDNNQTQDVDFQKFAFGFDIGIKWITDSNIVFSFNTSLGRNAYYNYDYDVFDAESIENQVNSSTYENSYSSTSGLDSKYWDFRIGLNVGYRFGAKKTTD
ncbi:DUF3575 domain-containing protein [Reichenbachiella ulvae]|uniref:DUF3575 domain-containing protein n=1 Tax=Reichenbachiella ulvae TaxID=2980104 RepID=A0ABT3CPY6_9BACT|nr:DUF3575 domain-containing protein [Reichenbachiella ulvae]MCV9385687.1 DUF3575 domain-containing protein [Reichenbachiella ulvae]